MNKSKTKVIWIGRKKHSKDKLNVKPLLDWGDTSFDLLGLHFSVDLESMIALNYNPTMSKIKVLLNVWKQRSLTPIGKITVIKTLLVPKFNHLFMSLPSPTPGFISEVNSLFFKFIWDNKPDKLKRSYLCQDYTKGGLRMICLNSFIASLKSTWIRRILSAENSLCSKLFNDSICAIAKLSKLGPMFALKKAMDLKNKFWIEVIEIWKNIIIKNPIRNRNQLLATPLWHNPLVAEYSLFYPKWFQNGIYFISDIVNPNDGQLLSLDQLKIKFGFNVNMLEYFRIKILYGKLIQNHQNFSLVVGANIFPLIPSHIEIFYKSRKGSRDMYNVLNTQIIGHKSRTKWSDELGVDITPQMWSKIYLLCLKKCNDQALSWLQYRILHNIIGTNEYLFKIGISNTNLCRLCNTSVETSTHLFYYCPVSHNIIVDTLAWVKNVIDIEIPLEPNLMLLGYLGDGAYSAQINLIILVIKKYLFHRAYFQKLPNIHSLLGLLEQSFTEQQMLDIVNCENENKLRSWERWMPLFLNI